MNVTIFGAGNMGRGIGYRMVDGGHSVEIIDSNPELSESLARELRLAAKKGAQVKTATLESAELGDVVVLALKYGINKEVVRQLGTRLEDRIVVDIANTFNASFDAIETETGTSSAEEVAKIVPSGAKVLKAFNTTFAGTLVEGKVAGIPLDVFLAGDDGNAKETLSELIRDGGMVPVDVGQLLRAREVEAMGFLNITLQMTQNLGFASALKIIHLN